MKILLMILTSTLLFIKCASIPAEAPLLSEELGKRISAIEKSNIKLLHNYFDLKRSEVDRFIEEEWVPTFAQEFFATPKIQEAWNTLVKENNPTDRLKFIQMLGPQLQGMINKKRTELITPLDELERTLEQKIGAAYMEARSINNSLTSFLVSASKVEENKNRYLSMFGISDEAVGRAIDGVNESVSGLLSKGKDVNEKVDIGLTYVNKIKQLKKELDGGK
jgi:hypothetical protein